MGAYERLVLRRPLLPIVLALAATGGLGWHVAHLQVDSSTESLFMEDDPELRVYYLSRHTYGSDEYVVVAFPNDDVFSTHGIQRVRDLSAEFGKIEGVGGVVSITSVPLFRSGRVLPPFLVLARTARKKDPKPMYLGDEDCDPEKARKELTTHRIYSRLLVSDDQKTTGIIVNLRIPPENQRLEKEIYLLGDEIEAAERSGDQTKGADLRRQRAAKDAEFQGLEVQRKADRTRIVRQAHEVAERYGGGSLSFYYSGVPVLIEDVAGYIYSDIVTFGGAVAAAFVVVLFVLYRRPRWVLLSLGTCLLTVVWTLGAMVIAGKKITLVSSNLSSLLFIIAMAHSLHLIRKFAEEQEDHPGRDDRENLLAAVRHLAGPCAFTMAAMIAGFSSLIISKIGPVRDLGTFMSLGVVLGYVATFVVLPAALAALPSKRALPERMWDGTLFLSAFAKVTEKLPRLTAAFAVLVIAASVWGTLRVKVETRLIDYFRPTTEVHEGLTFIDRNLGGTTTLEVLLESGKEDHFTRPETLEQVRRVHDWLLERPEVGKVVDIASFLDEFESLLGATKEKPYPIPPKTAIGQLKDAIGAETLRAYLREDGSGVRIFVRMRETSEKMDRQGVIDGLRKFLGHDPELSALKPQVTGVFVLYANMIQSLILEQIWIVLLGFGLICGVMFVLYRSLKVGFISVIPNIMHILFILGSMGFSGIRLDMITIMVASVSMGISVDCAIHYLCRFREELPRCGDYIEAMRRSHLTSGKAIFHTSLAVILGFCTLILSNFLPTVYFGVLTALAMASALFSCLSLVPIALLLIRPLPVVDSPKPGGATGG